MSVVLLAVVSLQTGFAATTSINNTTSGGISGALNSSTDGDIIELDEGTYTDNNNTNITINKNIKIQGKTKDKVILDAQGLSRIFLISYGLNVTFINITFINANNTLVSNANGGAIFANSLTYSSFINCTFLDNFALSQMGGYGGGAIYGNANSTIVIINSIFKNNINSHSGGAIYQNDNSILIITDSIFINNSGIHGGAIALRLNSILTIQNSTFINNSAGNNGGAICIMGGGNAIIKDSMIINNSASNGGGIYVISSNLTILNSTVNNNTANDGGGILSTTYDNSDDNTTVNIHDSDMYGNAANNDGGALSANTGVNSTGDSTINVFDSDIENNSAGNNGDSISATTGDGSSGNSEINVGGNSTIINNNPDKNDDGIFTSTGDGSSGSSSINIADGVIKRLSASSTIIVSKAIIGKPTTIHGIAKDQNNNLLANTNLIVTINGKTYTVTTNSAGEWSLTYIPTRLGDIQIRVTLNQNNVYTGFNSSTNFNVAKRNIIATITAKENKDGSVTIIANATYEDDNSPANGYLVDFLLDGKIVGTGITNKNGIAKFTIPANKITNRQHKITARVHGAETVNNADASILFTRTSPENEINETNKTNKTSNNPAATAAMKNTGIPITAILALLSTISLIAIRKKQN